MVRIVRAAVAAVDASSSEAPARLNVPTLTHWKLPSVNVAPQNSRLTSGSYLTLPRLVSSYSLGKFCLHWACVYVFLSSAPQIHQDVTSLLIGMRSLVGSQ